MAEIPLKEQCFMAEFKTHEKILPETFMIAFNL